MVIAVRVQEDRTMRTAAPVVAVLAILAISGAIVAAAIAGADQIALAPFLFAAVAAPAGVGALVAWRRPGERVAWILLARRAVGRRRDVRRPGQRPPAGSRPDLDGGTLDPGARRRVARAVPLAARARLPLPRRPAAGAALAHPLAHHARRRDGRARAAPVREAPPRAVRRRPEPDAGELRGGVRAHGLLDLLGRAARRPVRAARPPSGGASAARPASAVCRCCG